MIVDYVKMINKMAAGEKQKSWLVRPICFSFSTKVDISSRLNINFITFGT